MTLFESSIYGLVQGATEYLPVSSSAHLLILPHLLGQTDPGLAFDVMLHLGTLLATAAYFFKDWLWVLKNPLPKAQAQEAFKSLSWAHLGVGTLPAVLAGLLLNHWIEDHTRGLWLVGVCLAGFGILLWWVDRKAPHTRSLGEASIKDLFWIGCMQCLSLVPGVSRSGSTMTAARALGFTRADSARISFLLSLPITLGAVVYQSRHLDQVLASSQGMGPLVVGCLSALVFGALAIHALIKWVSKTSFAIFAVYRVILALGVILLA